MLSYRVRIAVKQQSPVERDISETISIIGRESGDIVVADALCSSRHAELYFSDGRLSVRDLGSTNGTFMRGERIEERALTAGDVITIGAATITILQLPDVGTGGTLVAPRNTQARSVTPRAPMPSAPAAVLSEAKTRVTPAVSVDASLASASTFQAIAASRSSRSRAWSVGAGVGVAVIALAGLGWFAWSRQDADKPTQASAAAKPAAARAAEARDGEATVKALWFSNGNPVKGGTSDITVRVHDNPSDGASVGVIEQYAGGTGNQWRTATWLAAFNAARAAGVSMVDHEYLVRAGGHIDGPSAGMLMTSTMMALLRDKPVIPTVTMTGTVNPDGSAGPVGGIVQKMQGAKEAGIKRIGYPMGSRNHQDLATGNMVDLHDAATSLGMEAVEVHDLYEAYELLTGDHIERPKAAAESVMELDVNTTTRLRAKVAAWKARVNKDLATVLELARKNPSVAQMLDEQLGLAKSNLDAAARWEASDLLVPAFASYVQLDVTLVMMREVARMLLLLLQFDVVGLSNQAKEASAVLARVNAYGAEAAINAKRTTVGGVINSTRALMAYAQGVARVNIATGRSEEADAALQAAREGKVTKPQAVEFMFPRMRDFLANAYGAEALLEAARDDSDFVDEQGSKVPADMMSLSKEAAAYGSAAGAALSYFDALYTEKLAGNHASKAMAQRKVERQEPAYEVARYEVLLTEHNTSAKSPSLILAAGLDAYLTSAGLVNKYYSLESTTNDKGEMVIQQRKALSSQLELARQHALEAATRAQERAGFVPVAAKLDYQAATAHREGNDAAKLEALQMFWSSAYWSSLTAQLSAR
jgi:uncharacterized protein